MDSNATAIPTVMANKPKVSIDWCGKIRSYNCNINNGNAKASKLITILAAKIVFFSVSNGDNMPTSFCNSVWLRIWWIRAPNTSISPLNSDHSMMARARNALQRSVKSGTQWLGLAFGKWALSKCFALCWSKALLSFKTRFLLCRWDQTDSISDLIMEYRAIAPIFNAWPQYCMAAQICCNVFFIIYSPE